MGGVVLELSVGITPDTPPPCRRFWKKQGVSGVRDVHNKRKNAEFVHITKINFDFLEVFI